MPPEITNAEAIEMMNRCEDDRCLGCGLNWWLFPPARIVHYVNHKRVETDAVRCVECKRVYERPLAQAQEKDA